MKSDERLREELQRHASRVAPKRLTAEDARRARTRQFGWVTATAVVVAAVLVASGFGLAAIRDAKTVPAADPDGRAFFAAGDMGRPAQVMAVNGGTTEWSVDVGYDPSLSLSPDGTKLFVASREPDPTDDPVPGSDVLRMLDAASGEILGSWPLAQPDPSRTRVEHTGPDFYPRITVSSDGQLIFVLQFTPGSQLEQSVYVGTFDRIAGRMLPESVRLDGCGRPPIMVALPAPRALAVVCSDGSTVATDQGQPSIVTNPDPAVMLLDIATDGSASSVRRVEIPATPGAVQDLNRNQLRLDALVDGLVTADKTLTVVARGGEVFSIDSASGSVSKQPTLAVPRGFVVPLNRVIPSASQAGSVDVGLRSLREFDAIAAQRLAEFDLSTGGLSRVVSDSRPFYAITAPRNGISFAIGPEGAVFGIDVVRGQQAPPAGAPANVVAVAPGGDGVYAV